LRELRLKERLTVKAAAERLEVSEATMWRVESGLTSSRSHFVEAACKIYGAPADLTEALKALAKETKARGWWQAYGDVIPEGFDVYMGLEEATSELSWYESELVPGLLQTKEYARTVIRADNPDVGDEEIDRRVHVRIARQALVGRTTAPPRLNVVLNEGILCRPVGGARVMRGQLERLREVAGMPNASLRVVPFSAGLHHGLMSGPFVILRFPLNGDGRESEPATVYMDEFTGALYLDKPHEVERYVKAFDSIWNSSLSESASRTRMDQAMKELRE
jgi:transcriptional regulator with XRE-family HTH domain